jgi:TetR/AcrR family transcriptional regulator, transcriptional repressor for nem operon
MARPREFDEERALDAAMRAFWVHGYEATSTQELCEATGLGRSSIYNCFTSKRELFRRALTRYTDAMTTAQLAIVADERRSVSARLRALFDSVIDGDIALRQDGRGIGCLTVNTTVELAAHDQDVAELLGRDQERRLTGLRTVLAAGQAAGDISTAQDPAAQARFVNAVIAGIRVTGQGGGDRAALEAVADTALHALTR